MDCIEHVETSLSLSFSLTLKQWLKSNLTVKWNSAKEISIKISSLVPMEDSSSGIELPIFLEISFAPSSKFFFSLCFLTLVKGRNLFLRYINCNLLEKLKPWNLNSEFINDKNEVEDHALSKTIIFTFETSNSCKLVIFNLS